MGHPHFENNGKLLQADKKFSDLKQRQKEQMNSWIEEAFSSYVKKHERVPGEKGRSEIAGYVLLRMDKAGIWLPEAEAKRRCNAVVSRLIIKYEAGLSPTLFKQSEYISEYDKMNTIRVTLKLNKSTDADIIEHLGPMPNRQGYIKNLIRSDIKDRNNEE